MSNNNYNNNDNEWTTVNYRNNRRRNNRGRRQWNQSRSRNRQPLSYAAALMGTPQQPRKTLLPTPASGLLLTTPPSTDEENQDLLSTIQSLADRMNRMETETSATNRPFTTSAHNQPTTWNTNPHTNQTTAPDTNVLSLLNQITQRLDRMEERMTKQKSTSGPPAHNGGPPTGEGTLSSNPHFHELWRGIFRGVQLKHHLRNWTTLPPSISKQLRVIAEQINPPMPSADTRELLVATMENAGRLLQDAVQDHIHEAIITNHHHLTTLDHSDLPRATAIAEKHLKRRLGKRVQAPQLETWIREETEIMEQPLETQTTTSPPLTHQTDSPSTPTRTGSHTPTRPVTPVAEERGNTSTTTHPTTPHRMETTTETIITPEPPTQAPPTTLPQGQPGTSDRTEPELTQATKRRKIQPRSPGTTVRARSSPPISRNDDDVEEGKDTHPRVDPLRTPRLTLERFLIARQPKPKTNPPPKDEEEIAVDPESEPDQNDMGNNITHNKSTRPGGRGKGDRPISLSQPTGGRVHLTIPNNRPKNQQH